MGRIAATPNPSVVLEADTVEPSMAEASQRMDALQARLFMAQRRAAEAELRRNQLDAEQAEFLKARQRDACRVEQSISELTVRARDYNRALNEAATLVDEMDMRILFFERQLAAVHETLAAMCTPAPSRSRDPVDVTEDDLSQDLDLIRKCADQNEWSGLRSRLSSILTP